MTTFYIISLILCLGTILFMRKCILPKIPGSIISSIRPNRILLILYNILAFIPFVNTILFIILVIVIATTENVKFKDNWFVRYFIKE